MYALQNWGFTTQLNCTRRGEFVGQVNNVLCYFQKQCSAGNYKLFQAYCSSFYGCKLWNLSRDKLVDFCTAWMKGIMRVWMFRQTHTAIFFLHSANVYLCTTKSVDALQTFYVLVFCIIRSWLNCWFVWYYSWTVWVVRWPQRFTLCASVRCHTVGTVVREEDRWVYMHRALYGGDNCWAGAVCWFFTGVHYAARQCFLITVLLHKNWYWTNNPAPMQIRWIS